MLDDGNGGAVALVGVDGFEVEKCLSRKSFDDASDLKRLTSLLTCMSGRYFGDVDERMPILAKLDIEYGKFGRLPNAYGGYFSLPAKKSISILVAFSPVLVVDVEPLCVCDDIKLDICMLDDEDAVVFMSGSFLLSSDWDRADSLGI